MRKSPDASLEEAERAQSNADNRARRIVRSALASILALTAIAAVGLASWFIAEERDREHAPAGLHIAELDVSGFDRRQIEVSMQRWASERGDRTLRVAIAGKEQEFKPKNLGFAGDAAASADHALSTARVSSHFARFVAFARRRFRAEILQPVVRFDAAPLANSLDTWQAQAITDPPFEGGIAVSGREINPRYPRAGTTLDRARSTAELRRAVIDGSNALLVTRTEQPAIVPSEVDRVVAEARALAASGVELSSPDGTRKFEVSAAQLASLLEVSVDRFAHRLVLDCAPEATKRVFEPERSNLERPAQNAHFVIDDHDQVHIEPSHPALVLDERLVARAVCEAAANPKKTAELPFLPGAEPTLSTEAADAAHVKGLVASFTTRHACCQPRVTNIHHIADLLDETLVSAGATFSLNRVVGPRTIKNGFHAAPSIEDGDMVDTVGGGVSQFATTLFNALFYGGYDIVERQPHSYWFTRYPMGYDATLSYPHPDIAFKNDTAAGALIETQYTDTSITVKVYGDNGGRRVRAEVSPRQNIVLPPVEFIPNPRLDADREKTREGGMIGWTVVVKRTITFPDGTRKEERRKVTYRPRARRVEVHPCRIPAGQPGYTGERCPVPDPERSRDNPEEASDEHATRTSLGADGGAK